MFTKELSSNVDSFKGKFHSLNILLIVVKYFSPFPLYDRSYIGIILFMCF